MVFIVCKKLSSIGMTIHAYGRSSRSAAELRQLCDQFGIWKYSTDLAELLPLADYVVSIMPATAHTDGLLDHETLRVCAAKVLSAVGH